MSESIEGLTGTESTVLLVLASAVEPVRNPDLKLLGPALEAPSRRRLVERGLIEVGTGERRSLLLSLTDKGWAAAAELLESPPPPRAAPQLRALFTFASGIGRYLRRESLALGEIVTPPDAPRPAAAPPASASASASDGAPTDRVRAAYRAVAAFGSWVALRDLRAALPGVPRTVVDEGLRDLYPEPGVHIVAEDNLKALTPDDHAAALQLGGRPLHAIRITR